MSNLKAAEPTFEGRSYSMAPPTVNIDPEVVKHQKAQSLELLSTQLDQARKSAENQFDAQKQHILMSTEHELMNMKAQIEQNREQKLVAMEAEYRQQLMQIEQAAMEQKMKIEQTAAQLVMQARQQKLEREMQEMMNKMELQKQQYLVEQQQLQAQQADAEASVSSGQEAVEKKTTTSYTASTPAYFQNHFTGFTPANFNFDGFTVSSASYKPPAFPVLPMNYTSSNLLTGYPYYLQGSSQVQHTPVGTNTYVYSSQQGNTAGAGQVSGSYTVYPSRTVVTTTPSNLNNDQYLTVSSTGAGEALSGKSVNSLAASHVVSTSAALNSNVHSNQPSKTPTPVDPLSARSQRSQQSRQ